MSKTKNSAEILGIDPDKLWKKIGEPLIQEDMMETREDRAERLVSEAELTPKEFAFLLLVAADALFTSGGQL